MHGKLRAFGPVNQDRMIERSKLFGVSLKLYFKSLTFKPAKDCLHLPEGEFAELRPWQQSYWLKKRQTAHPLRLSQIGLAYKRDISNPIRESQDTNQANRNFRRDKSTHFSLVSSEYCKQKAHMMSYHHTGPTMAGWRRFYLKGAFSLPASELPFISIPSTIIAPSSTQSISGTTCNLSSR